MTAPALPTEVELREAARAVDAAALDVAKAHGALFIDGGPGSVEFRHDINEARAHVYDAHERLNEASSALRTAIRAALDKRGEVSAASAASARALGGDGEPVACPECAARKPDDGDWWARQVLKAKSLAALKSIAEGWPMSRPAATGAAGDVVGGEPFEVVALFEYTAWADSATGKMMLEKPLSHLEAFAAGMKRGAELAKMENQK